LPTLSSFPGATPAHAARRGAVSKRDLSLPISATITSAPRGSLPGMVSQSSTARGKGRGGETATDGTRLTASSSGCAAREGSAVLSAFRAAAMAALSASLCASRQLMGASCLARHCRWWSWTMPVRACSSKGIFDAPGARRGGTAITGVTGVLPTKHATEMDGRRGLRLIESQGGRGPCHASRDTALIVPVISRSDVATPSEAQRAPGASASSGA